MALKDTNKGKLIYQPQGPAGEYAKWAVNLHNGCTHGCTYCYNNRGFMSHAFGTEPKLARPLVMEAKKIYKEKTKDVIKELNDEVSAIIWRDSTLNAVDNIIRADIKKIGKERLRNDGGVFFSFKCDPLDENNIWHTYLAARWFCIWNIPVTILTKSTEWMEDVNWQSMLKERQDLLTIGFTLTGMDDMEVNAPSTTERIEALRKVHEMGIKTFVSLEPVIDISKAIDVLHDCLPYSDEIRIGLQSPYKKDRYTRSDIIRLLAVEQPMKMLCPNVNIVLKNSVYRQCEAFGIKVDKVQAE